jgi:hypothetical protein
MIAVTGEEFLDAAKTTSQFAFNTPELFMTV